MSGDDKDPSQKTEEATAHHLEEARKKGQIPTSKEVSHLFALVAMALILGFLAPSIGKNMLVTLRPFIEKPFDLSHDTTLLPNVLTLAFWETSKILALPFLALALGGLAAAGLQTRFHLTFEHVKPKFSKLSLGKGIKRLFSLKALVEFGKSLLKLALVGSVTFLILRPEFGKLSALTGLSPWDIFGEIRGLLLELLIALAVALLVIAALDYGFQWFQHKKELRMTKEDVKDEYKKLEGNPEVKARRRREQRKLSSKRTLQEVPHATVLITNPTHFAVALKWIEDEMEAPVVIAKGQDLIALKMREVAQEHEVPIVENPPLARTLYASLEVDETIRAEHYAAVAEVIRFVMETGRRRA